MSAQAFVPRRPIVPPLKPVRRRVAQVPERREFMAAHERERMLIAQAEAEARQRRALNRWEEPVWASWLIVGGRLA